MQKISASCAGSVAAGFLTPIKGMGTQKTRCVRNDTVERSGIGMMAYMHATFRRRYLLLGGLAVVALGMIIIAAGLRAADSSPLPVRWCHWSYSRPIVFAAGTQAGYVNITIPFDVYANSKRDLDDLRLIDDKANEVPFVLYAHYGESSEKQLAAKMGEISFAPGKFTQAVLELNEQSPFHNAVYINTPLEDFIAWCEVAVSDDARTWRIVNDRSPIFRFQKNNQTGVQRLHYPQTNARFMRLRIFDGTRQFPIEGAVLFYSVTLPAEEVPAPVVLKPTTKATAQRSIWSADLGASLFPLNEVRFTVDQKDFSRHLEVQVSDDGTNWWSAGEGEIYRFSENGVEREWLRAGLSETTQRHWRVTVNNGDDPPLAGAQPALFATPRMAIFRYDPARSYRLIYGQSEAKPAHYDLSRWIGTAAYKGAAAATVGAEAANPNRSDPRPWTEQNGTVLWIALGIAVLLLGYSALRSLQRISKET